MAIQATIFIDDDRWAKHPYGIKFDDEECNAQFYRNGLDDREACYKVIHNAKNAGFEIDEHIEEYFY
ncbi:MAG: hypothetical protein J6A25_10395 [Lachnospiraceae bacterium]|nr:hypothetical protein [Lachnospiraceae bacterium]